MVCLQEPYVGKKHVIGHPGFQIRWPECAKKDTRVASAIQNEALNRYVFEERTDLVDSPNAGRVGDNESQEGSNDKAHQYLQ